MAALRENVGGGTDADVRITLTADQAGRNKQMIS